MIAYYKANGSNSYIARSSTSIPRTCTDGSKMKTKSEGRVRRGDSNDCTFCYGSYNAGDGLEAALPLPLPFFMLEANAFLSLTPVSLAFFPLLSSSL